MVIASFLQHRQAGANCGQRVDAVPCLRAGAATSPSPDSATPSDLDPHTEFNLLVYEPGGASSQDGALVRHHGSEYGMVISGRLSVQLGFETYELGPQTQSRFSHGHHIAWRRSAKRSPVRSGSSWTAMPLRRRRGLAVGRSGVPTRLVRYCIGPDARSSPISGEEARRCGGSGGCSKSRSRARAGKAIVGAKQPPMTPWREP